MGQSLPASVWATIFASFVTTFAFAFEVCFETLRSGGGEEEAGGTPGGVVATGWFSSCPISIISYVSWIGEM